MARSQQHRCLEHSTPWRRDSVCRHAAHCWLLAVRHPFLSVSPMLLPLLHTLLSHTQAATYLAIKNEPVGAAGQQQQLQLVLHGQQQQQAAAGYLCPTCVQQAADACPLDLLQLHAALLADIKPRRPRSAADIHAAELTRKVGVGGEGVGLCGGVGEGV